VTTHTHARGWHGAFFDPVSGLALPWLYRAIADRVIDDLPPAGRLLDIGSGPGRLLVTLARRRPDAHLVGIDPSTDMDDRAQARIGKAGIADHVATRVAGTEDLPFPDSSFDVVVSSLSAHHWTDIAQAVREQARVLRPGGHLWVFDLHRRQSAVAASLGGTSGVTDVTQPRLGTLRDRILFCHRATKSSEAPTA
jgi:ubiquinone/menaquinone biosynthesis C-methylase UbiE